MLPAATTAPTTTTNVFRTPKRTLFTPSTSSPLSPRRAPPHAARAAGMLPSPPRSPPSFLTPRRAIRPVPSPRSGDDARNARRLLFLKKLADSRDDKTWSARGGDDEVCPPPPAMCRQR